VTLSEGWQLYVADKTIEGLSPNTLGDYKTQMNMLIRYFGDKDINGITVFDLKRYLAEKGSHLMLSSLGQRIRVMRTLFRYFSDEGFCEKNPAARLKEPKLPDQIPKAFSEEETVMLEEACKNPKEHALTEFFFSTGCRISEVQALNKSDINWENRSCVVMGKGSKQREVYFSIKAKIWLKWYIDSRKDADLALFVTDRAPHRMSKDTMRRNIKIVGKQSNLGRNMYPHMWRHTFATHMLNAGAPIEGVQEQLGHTSIKVTRRYCRLSGVRRKQIHDTYF